MPRYYSVESGYGAGAVVLRWGLSRFGDATDSEMQETVARGMHLGSEHFCVGWTPRRGRPHSPERMLQQRIGNMERRIRRKWPLYADQFIADEMRRDKFTLAACRRDAEIKTDCHETWVAEFWAKFSEDKRIVLPSSVPSVP